MSRSNYTAKLNHRASKWTSRSSVAKKHMDSDRVVEHYKSPAKVECAFQCMKTVDLLQENPLDAPVTCIRLCHLEELY